MNKDDLDIKLNKLLEDVEGVESKIGYLVLPLHKLSEKILFSVSKVLEDKYQLSYSEFDALVTLKASGDSEYTLAPTDLYTHMLFSSGGMTKLLKKLEGKDYITRINNPQDKRSMLVKLTEKGNQIMQLAVKDIIEVEEKLLARINQDEKRDLTHLLVRALHSAKMA